MTNDSFIIAQAERQDIEDIMRVEQNAFVNGVVEESTLFMERIEVFPQGFLLLKDKKITAGYFCGELWEGSIRAPYSADLFALGHSASGSHKKDGTLLYISSMGILSAYRGKGLGGFLFTASMEYIVKKQPQIERIILLVNEAWLPARAIYKKEGFSEVQILPDFFKDASKPEAARQNGIIMEKQKVR